MSPERKPTIAACKEALNHPCGWVYEIDGDYGPEEEVPPYAIAGAWKVDADGRIIGEFVPNPNYRARVG